MHVKHTVNLGTAGLTPFAGTTQYSGTDIMNLVARIKPNLPEGKADTVYLALTGRDINSPDRSLRFNFALHDKATRIGVISVARLVLGEGDKPADDKIVWSRVYKMTKRLIGDVYFGYSRSADIHYVMYSPIMSLDDVDKMGQDYPSATK